MTREPIEGGFECPYCLQPLTHDDSEHGRIVELVFHALGSAIPLVPVLAHQSCVEDSPTAPSWRPVQVVHRKQSEKEP